MKRQQYTCHLPYNRIATIIKHIIINNNVIDPCQYSLTAMTKEGN